MNGDLVIAFNNRNTTKNSTTKKRWSTLTFTS